MEKVTFYHIKNKFNNSNTNNNTFKCVVLKGKKLQEYQKHYSTFEVLDDKKYYCPVDTISETDAFVHGIGWIKTKNYVYVPYYDGEIDHWTDYVEKYGYECLFYSLTGYVMHTFDCCALPMQREFKSLVGCIHNWGFHKYTKFVELFKKINQIQVEVLHTFDWMTKYYDFTNEYIFMPHYCIGGLIPDDPYCDVLADDEKLEKLYRTKRNRELNKQGKKAIEIADILDEEIINGVFPVSTKERIKYFFGDECSKLYEQILEEFKAEY